jgi:cation diffusion facilitator CzcD-associated flavoprotein CzcO
VPRERFVTYLEDYTRAFDIQPRFGEAVTRAEVANGGWRVETSAGVHEARNVVVATGYAAAAHRPALAGADGAASVDLCIRGPIHVITRDLLGIPTQVMAVLTLWIPLPLRDVIFRALMRVVVGDLSSFGIRAPREGILAQVVNKGRVALIDVGTVDLIRKGRIHVRPDIRELTPAGASFTDSSEGAYDAIVLATGFRSGLEAFLLRASEVLDERGTPRRHGCETELPGLYFVGFYIGEGGQLREIGLQAERVAKAISRKFAGTEGRSTAVGGKRG